MDSISRYVHGHLFKLYGAPRTALIEQLCEKLGGVGSEELKEFDNFKRRMTTLTQFALEHNTLLYADAEQTYIQRAIESFG